ncbi:MAG: beta-ketoacyl-ACP synthase [Prochloraceae cyanobacterium]|nr:beta-ketoacyl-ACP synthase [Prochloraceae cyanobacterium]
MEVVVTGLGLFSAFGDLDRSWQNLIAGNSAIKLEQPLPELPSFPLALIAKKSTNLDVIINRVVSAALNDAGIYQPLPNCGVAIGSSRSYQGIWEQLATKKIFADNFNWEETLPSFAATFAARKIGSRGLISAPMAACATGIWSLAKGFEWIETGQCNKVIAGAVESPITPLTLAGFQRIGALAKTGCYPFDRHREGLVLGEGGAVLVLESAESAIARNAKIYGQILGFGLTCDAHHISAPESTGKEATAAFAKCLENSNLQASDIDYIHAHGTSTKLNDIREAELISRVFGDRVAVSSTKGATGHTLGASGAIGSVFCLMALKHSQLPPCVGLKESEFTINVEKESRFANLKTTLCLSFGFGGQNAVIAIGKYHKT